MTGRYGPRDSALDYFALGHKLARRASNHPVGSWGRAWCIRNARDSFRIARDYRRFLPGMKLA